MIAYFVYNLGAYSGAALQALNLAGRLEHEVLIFNIGESYRGSLRPHLRVVNLESGLFGRCGTILRELLARRVSMVHFHGQFLLPMAIAALLSIPYVIKTTLLGDDDFDSVRALRLGWLRLWLSKRCAANVVLSMQLEEINAKHINRAKIRRINNGVEMQCPCPELKDKRNHFLFCGVISRRKRTAEAIRAFAENYSKLQRSMLYVVGPDQPCGVSKEVDQAYIESCRRLAVDLGVAEKVQFVGLISQAQLFALARTCKALLLFSEREGMPNVVLEAMAANCVPIVSGMHGVGEEIVGEGGGFVCDPEGCPPIEKINELILSKGPYRRAESVFSFEATVEALTALYKELGRR